MLAGDDCTGAGLTPLAKEGGSLGLHHTLDRTFVAAWAGLVGPVVHTVFVLVTALFIQRVAIRAVVEGRPLVSNGLGKHLVCGVG